MVKHNAQKKKVSFIYFHLSFEIGNCSVYIYICIVPYPSLYSYFMDMSASIVRIFCTIFV